MKTIIAIASVVAALALANGSASAQQIYGGVLESTTDTTGAGCGDKVGEHYFIEYRPQTVTPALPAGIYVKGRDVTVYIQSTDPSGDFFTDGTAGHVKGTVLFSAAAQSPGVFQQTFGLAPYTLMLDTTDPAMFKITKMTLKFTLKPSNTACHFIWNGVLAPALMPAG